MQKQARLRYWRGLWLSGYLYVLIGMFTPLRAGDFPLTARSSHPHHSLITRKLLLSTAGAAVSFGLGAGIGASIDEVHRDPLIGAPPRLDRFFRDHLHESGRTTNFIDTHGSLTTAVGGVTAVVLLERLVNDESTWAGAAHELAVFGIGALTEQGFKLAIKSTVARRRPRLEFADPAHYPALNAQAENHKSFYSGHASEAFYVATYADQKVGDLLSPRVQGRTRFLYRTLSIAGFYGWATYTSYSRIQIDQHYFTDVLAGGAVGAAWGLWHYRYHHGKDGRWSVVPELMGERVGVMILFY